MTVDTDAFNREHRAAQRELIVDLVVCIGV
jgi:hypothetical protein